MVLRAVIEWIELLVTSCRLKRYSMKWSLVSMLKRANTRPTSTCQTSSAVSNTNLDISLFALASSGDADSDHWRIKGRCDRISFTCTCLSYIMLGLCYICASLNLELSAPQIDARKSPSTPHTVSWDLFFLVEKPWTAAYFAVRGKPLYSTGKGTLAAGKGRERSNSVTHLLQKSLIRHWWW